MIEWLVQQGQQVFAISWRNPDVEQGHFDLDTYAAAVLEARDAVAAITGAPAVHLNGACSGGIISAGVLGHLAAEDRLGDVASVTMLVAALDNARAGTAAALTGREAAAAAVADSARRGYLDGRALSAVFTWLRPNDLIWTTSSTTTCSASSRPPSTCCSGTRTPSGSPPACTATSSAWRWRTRSRGPACSRCSAARSTSAPSSSTATSSWARTITSSRGRTPTAAPSCWAARRASCSPPAATSRRSSIPRRPLEPNRAPATGSAASIRRRPRRGCSRPRQTGQLVARLRRVARAALRRAQARAQASRRSGLQGTREGPRRLRPRELRRER